MWARKMIVGSLFSGIGGFDLGFERAGFEIAWMCEKSEYCRRILHKHWPNVRIYDDITKLEKPRPVNVLIGGFPCTDIAALLKASAKAVREIFMFVRGSRYVISVRHRERYEAPRQLSCWVWPTAKSK